jgi:hypothetical protein
MAVFTVTHAQRVDDYAVIQTLEDTDITTGQTIVVAGVGNNLTRLISFRLSLLFCFLALVTKVTSNMIRTSPSRISYLSSQTSTTIRDLQQREQLHGRKPAHGPQLQT